MTGGLDVDLDKIAKWDARDRAAAQAEIGRIELDKIQRWYCNRGRICDGEPHTDYEYPHARADQWPPVGNDWFVWFLRSGRGSGKTRSGSNWVRNAAKKTPYIAGIGRRGPDVRMTMIEGRSGLIASCIAAGESYDWKPALKQFTFQNGAKFMGYSAEEPDSLRGPEHGAAWLDEPSHMDLIEEVWYNLKLGLRVPGLPGGAKVLATSTPLPNKWTKEISALPNTRVVRVSTEANIKNLDRSYLENVIDPLRGTRIGRQELEGELLEDVEGSLWKAAMIQRREIQYEELERIVISIDPAGTANKKSDETGIVAVGGLGDYGYVLADESGKYSPEGWADKAKKLYESLSADAIIVEVNFGGDMVRRNLEASGFKGRIIESRAVRGKQTRAEPAVGNYERGKVYHVGNTLSQLEEEMITWVPGKGASPNRIDALVWGLDEIMRGRGKGGFESPRGHDTVPELSPEAAAARSNNPIARLAEAQRRAALRRRAILERKKTPS